MPERHAGILVQPMAGIIGTAMDNSLGHLFKSSPSILSEAGRCKKSGDATHQICLTPYWSTKSRIARAARAAEGVSVSAKVSVKARSCAGL